MHTESKRSPRTVLSGLWAEKKNRLLLLLTGVFLVAFFVPWSAPRVSAAVDEAFLMLAEYAHDHVLLCLVPAFRVGVLGWLRRRFASAVANGQVRVSVHGAGFRDFSEPPPGPPIDVTPDPPSRHE